MTKSSLDVLFDWAIIGCLALLSIKGIAQTNRIEKLETQIQHLEQRVVDTDMP